MATTSPPYTAVVTILPGSRSAGMNTTDGTPARAACAATELARLPVDAQAYRSKPSARAAVRATETTRSLNEWVGLAESSLTYSGARQADRRGQRVGRHQRGQAGVERDPATPGRRRPAAGRRSARCSAARAAICSRVTRAQRGLVVADLQRAETLVTGVLGGERELGAAAATDQVAGGRVAEDGGWPRARS